jgi:hypothetical protein
MSKTIKTPKPEDTTVRWLHKAVNADGTVANGTFYGSNNAAKRDDRALRKALRGAKRG